MSLFFGGGKKAKNFWDVNWENNQDILQYAETSSQDYLLMIKTIVQNGQVVTLRPNQFDHGVSAEFIAESPHGPSKRSFKVIVTCSDRGFSYVLSCFDISKPKKGIGIISDSADLYL